MIDNVTSLGDVVHQVKRCSDALLKMMFCHAVAECIAGHLEEAAGF